MIDLIINGINGKMGKHVYKRALEDKNFNLVCGVDKRPFGDFNCPVYQTLTDAQGHFDVLIDFSSPTALGQVLQFAKEYKCALVLATTGYTKSDEEQIKEASKIIPIHKTANTSEGINALYEVVERLAVLLADFDVNICETHGKNKKDNPSGTALLFKKILEKNKKAPQITGFRGGNVAGIHEITFIGEEEIISIKHTALSRAVFAKGALEVAKKLYTLPAGLYTSI